jgi:hypothetical protein
MKNLNFLKLFKGALTVGFLLLIALTATGFIDLYGLFISATTGTTLAFATAAGTFTTETSTTETVKEGSGNLLDKTVSQNITEMKPAATPLDTILREIGMTVPIQSWDYHWYNIDQRAIEDTLKAGHLATGESSGANTVFELEVNNIGNIAIDDNIMFLAREGGDDQPLVVHVVGKYPTQNKITVLALNGLGTNKRDLPLLEIADKVIIIGNAKAEKDAQTTPYAAYPQDTFNYAQIHMAQIEQSVYEKLHKKEVNWNVHNYRLQSIYDLKRKMELTSLWGVKGRFYDPIDGDYKYMSDGITRIITKGLEYPATITNDVFAGWGKDIFTGNSGSDKRVMFTGGTLMRKLLATPTITKQIEAKQTEVVWGIRFSKIDTGFGELLVKYHNLFDTAGWAAKGLVLDANYLEKAVFKPMATRNLMLKESGQKNVDAQLIEEAFCVATRYPDLHAIIAPE